MNRPERWKFSYESFFAQYFLLSLVKNIKTTCWMSIDTSRFYFPGSEITIQLSVIRLRFNSFFNGRFYSLFVYLLSIYLLSDSREAKAIIFYCESDLMQQGIAMGSERK